MNFEKNQTSKQIDSYLSNSYKYGFITDIKEDRIQNGLNRKIIKKISSIKNEPKWLLDWRLKAFMHWEKMNEPKWSNLKYPKIDFQSMCYYSAPKKKKKPKIN